MNFRACEVSSKFNESILSLKGLVHETKFLEFSEHTPEILQTFGLPDYPIYIPLNKLTLGLYTDDNYNHGHKNEIGKRNLIKCLPHIGDPMAISTFEDGVVGVYLEDKASTGRPSYVVIKEDKIRHLNIILSVYGRISMDNENIVYVDNTRINGCWNTNNHLVIKFKNKLKDLIFLQKVTTKSDILKEKIKNG